MALTPLAVTPFRARKGRPDPVQARGIASWLNQTEMWFSMLARKVIRCSNFTSVDDLNEKLTEFFNKPMAKPFRWTNDGKPLAA